MKKFIFTFAAVTGAFFVTTGSYASDVMVASAMQRCTTNAECTLITNSCADNCGFVPVNKQNLPSAQSVYQSRCGKPMEANPQCNINPPIAAACINSRCTIDYAYANNAGAKDYQAGAYPVSEAAVPSRVPASAAPANDRHGYTAYNIPSSEVRQNTLGEIRTTIYVPPSAPVSGGNYVALPYVPPAGVPLNATPPAPAQAAPAKAIPATQQPASQPVFSIAPKGAVVETPQPKPQPTATTTPKKIATPADPIPSSAPGNIPEPRIPDTEPVLIAPSPDTGIPDAPIPPSDFKEQKLAPPPGATSLVAPEDPGAVPKNMVLQDPVPRGPDDATMSIKKNVPPQTINP